MPHVAKICIYPIKSLDGVELTQGRVLETGALEGDRQYAIFDAQGKFVNGKRHGKIHLLRTKFDLESQIISLQIQGNNTKENFHLEAEKQPLEAWLSDFFGFSVKLHSNLLTGFPDDTVSPGPTIVSTATLKKVASWYPDLSITNIRRRMRTTIEVDGVPAFWEDQLFSANDDVISLKVGNVQFAGVNPCQRCIVPTRNAVTGKADSGFQKTFINKRKETLPEWVNASRFNHFYKLTVNTRLADEEIGNKLIQVGDQVSF